MEPTFLKDVESVELIAKAKKLFDNGDHNMALEIIEDMILVNKEDKNIWFLHTEEGKMLMNLAQITENPDLDFTFILGSVGCFWEDVKLSGICAHGLHNLAQQIESVLYYKKCVQKAKLSLSVPHPDSLTSLSQKTYKDVETLIKDAEFKIALSKAGNLKSSVQDCEPEDLEVQKTPEPLKNEVKGLRSFWLGLDVKIKRDFMKVSTEKLISFVEGVHYRKGRDVLEQVLASANEEKKWAFWMCKTICLKKFSSAEDLKKHLEDEHAADIKPSFEEVMIAKRIGKDWARKISGGGWKPVDTVAAVEMIKNRLSDVKAFAYKNGWSKQWPLAEDEKRSELLEKIKFCLGIFCDLKILPGSIRDYVMHFPVRHLGKLEVSEQTLIDCHLVGTPQSICFLECPELSDILDFLKRIKCERDDGTELVCRAVDSILGSTRVKEKIDFDPQFSFLLLDKRLLKSNNALLDDEGTINVYEPDVHYGKAHAQGDDIISWLTDYNSVDKIFPRPIRQHNLDIWVAVLRAVQFTCRTLETKYTKKVHYAAYSAALNVVEDLCKSEYKRRRDFQDHQWNGFASLLCDRCEEGVPEPSLATALFVFVVRDVVEGALDPIFYFPDYEACLNFIRERKNIGDNIVLKSIASLKTVVKAEAMLIDSKMLMVDNSRISLLNDLIRLSVFDNRTYILQVLKPFLLNEIVNMESKAKSAAAVAAEADLLLEEEKKSQPKKKKTKSKKKTASSLDKTVENKPSVNLEPESTSSSLKKVEEDSKEPEDTLASERGRLEISSNTVNQEEGSKVDPGSKRALQDVHNMPGEDSLLEHFEPVIGAASATRYNSALDMTLKALLNIKILKEDLMQNIQPFQDHLEEQVPSALQNFFTAFVSDVIKTDGVYSCLVSELLASLEQVLSMWSDAAEVLVAVLESWHCWKNPERESLVTRLFTLEEDERMSCRKCRRKSNYPEQSCYGIVIAADSIRDLKCALQNTEFVDILKVNHMEYKMLCDIRMGGCGKKNAVHHIISRCPPIFTIVLEWEKNETEKEISETTKALHWEIDISRLYKGLERNTNYRLVSMVGCGELEEEHICLVYENNWWVNLRHDALAGEDVGNWKSVVRFCGERMVRPEILFYEAVRPMALQSVSRLKSKTETCSNSEEVVSFVQ